MPKSGDCVTGNRRFTYWPYQLGIILPHLIANRRGSVKDNLTSVAVTMRYQRIHWMVDMFSGQLGLPLWCRSEVLPQVCQRSLNLSVQSADLVL